MSYSEMINYEALSLKSKAICGQAQKGLSHIDEMLARINASSSTLLSVKIKNYETYLLKEKASILSQIEMIKTKADEQAKIGTKRMKIGTPEMEIYNRRNELIQAANTLQNQVDDILVSKIEVLNKLINDELVELANKTSSQLRNAIYGVYELDKSLLQYIEKIEDIALRESVYREAIKAENRSLSLDQLMEKGVKSLEELTKSLLDKHRERILEGIRKDMEASRVDQETIKKTLQSSESIQKIRAQATDEIIGEEVRKESLKIILKAIEARGFMVDRKNSIKINRDKNEVNVIGKKASGQTAEFTIYLDGRFSYKFDGFEGQACQKDIEPFMDDLEDVYGMKITSRLELWKNPDKLSSQKYQAINTNKGKN